MKKLLKPGQTADEWANETIGDWIDEKCPICGCQLLGNKKGDKWCDFAKCSWNTWDEDCPHDEDTWKNAINGRCPICGERKDGS